MTQAQTKEKRILANGRTLPNNFTKKMIVERLKEHSVFAVVSRLGETPFLVRDVRILTSKNSDPNLQVLLLEGWQTPVEFYYWA